MNEKTAPAKAHAPTLLGLAALADISGLHMLSNSLCKAHDMGSGLYSSGEPSARLALQVIAETEQVWRDAAACERAFGDKRKTEPAARIKEALRLLAVARSILGG